MAKHTFLKSVLVVARSQHRTDSDEGIHCLIRALAGRCESLKVISLAFEASELLGPSFCAPRQAARGWQHVGGVACHTLPAPWSSSDAFGAVARWLTPPAFEAWAGWPSRELDAATASADLIILHSDPALALLGRLRRLAPEAKIVLYADDPETSANQHPRLRASLIGSRSALDHIVVTARSMLKHFEAFGTRVSYVQRGLDLPSAAQVEAVEYDGRAKIVCTAPTTFDASAVQIVADALPQAEIHLVGSNTPHRYPANVRVHSALTDQAYAALVGGARVGIVPLAGQAEVDGIADTDAGLLHFGHIGVPTVCPAFAVGEHPLRFGYQPGRSASIRDALARSLQARWGSARVPVLSWSQVAQRVIETIERESRVAWERRDLRAREAAHEG